MPTKENKRKGEALEFWLCARAASAVVRRVRSKVVWGACKTDKAQFMEHLVPTHNTEPLDYQMVQKNTLLSK